MAPNKNRGKCGQQGLPSPRLGVNGPGSGFEDVVFDLTSLVRDACNGMGGLPVPPELSNAVFKAAHFFDTMTGTDCAAQFLHGRTLAATGVTGANAVSDAFDVVWKLLRSVKGSHVPYTTLQRIGSALHVTHQGIETCTEDFLQQTCFPTLNCLLWLFCHNASSQSYEVKESARVHTVVKLSICILEAVFKPSVQEDCLPPAYPLSPNPPASSKQGPPSSSGSPGSSTVNLAQRHAAFANSHGFSVLQDVLNCCAVLSRSAGRSLQDSVASFLATVVIQLLSCCPLASCALTRGGTFQPPQDIAHLVDTHPPPAGTLLDDVLTFAAHTQHKLWPNTRVTSNKNWSQVLFLPAECLVLKMMGEASCGEGVMQLLEQRQSDVWGLMKHVTLPRDQSRGFVVLQSKVDVAIGLFLWQPSLHSQLQQSAAQSHVIPTMDSWLGYFLDNCPHTCAMDTVATGCRLMSLIWKLCQGNKEHTYACLQRKVLVERLLRVVDVCHGPAAGLAIPKLLTRNPCNTAALAADMVTEVAHYLAWLNDHLEQMIREDEDIDQEAVDLVKIALEVNRQFIEFGSQVEEYERQAHAVIDEFLCGAVVAESGPGAAQQKQKGKGKSEKKKKKKNAGAAPRSTESSGTPAPPANPDKPHSTQADAKAVATETPQPHETQGTSQPLGVECVHTTGQTLEWNTDVQWPSVEYRSSTGTAEALRPPAVDSRGEDVVGAPGGVDNTGATTTASYHAASCRGAAEQVDSGDVDISYLLACLCPSEAPAAPLPLPQQGYAAVDSSKPTHNTQLHGTQAVNSPVFVPHSQVAAVPIVKDNPMQPSYASILQPYSSSSQASFSGPTVCKRAATGKQRGMCPATHTSSQHVSTSSRVRVVGVQDKTPIGSVCEDDGFPPLHAADVSRGKQPGGLRHTSMQVPPAWSPVRHHPSPISHQPSSAMTHQSSSNVLGCVHVDEVQGRALEEDVVCCPITAEVMVDPVIATDGYTYERAAILAWFAGHDTSPMTNMQLTSRTVIPNRAVKALIQQSGILV